MKIIATHCCSCISGPVFFLKPLLPEDRRRNRFVAQMTTCILSCTHFAGQNVLRRLYLNLQRVSGKSRKLFLRI